MCIHNLTMRANYHTHSTFCDGSCSPEKMVIAAIDEGYDILGFSSHAPLPWPTAWSLKYERLFEYRDTIRELARRYSGKLELLLGLELDWIPGAREPGDAEMARISPDYRIGSVHYVSLPDGTLSDVAVDTDDFETLLATSFHGDARALVKAYYGALRDMAEKAQFDIVGHFDLILKNNRSDVHFDPNARWYRDAAMEALEAVSRSHLIMEINTGAFASGKTDEPYPALWLLKEFKTLGGRVTIDADAHTSEQLRARHHAHGVGLLKKAGYREVTILTAGKWIETALD
jgi:histidinol-phosphatase (PHP family)